jgi:excisionase family DNA binding protein
MLIMATTRQAAMRPNGPELLTIAEVALVLNCSRVTVWRRVRSGELPCLYAGGGTGRGRMIRVARTDLVDYLRKVNAP